MYVIVKVEDLARLTPAILLNGGITTSLHEVANDEKYKDLDNTSRLVFAFELLKAVARAVDRLRMLKLEQVPVDNYENVLKETVAWFKSFTEPLLAQKAV